MKLIYIAGPYRQWQDDEGTVSTIAHNIMDAREVAAEFVRRLQGKGFFPVTPHLNTAHFERLTGLDVVEDAYWLDGTAELLKRCDAVLMTRVDAAKVSSGTANEILLALKLGKPVYRTLEELESCITYCPERMTHVLVPPFTIPLFKTGRS